MGCWSLFFKLFLILKSMVWFEKEVLESPNSYTSFVFGLGRVKPTLLCPQWLSPPDPLIATRCVLAARPLAAILFRDFWYNATNVFTQNYSYSFLYSEQDSAISSNLLILFFTINLYLLQTFLDWIENK